jgi:hypothetical protein
MNPGSRIVWEKNRAALLKAMAQFIDERRQGDEKRVKTFEEYHLQITSRGGGYPYHQLHVRTEIVKNLSELSEDFRHVTILNRLIIKELDGRAL